jgi:hypothetical protein
MAQPHDPGACHPPDPGNGDHKGNGAPIAACCLLMLAGAVGLVVAHRAGVVFLILFASCTALVASLMAGISWLGVRRVRRPRVRARRFPSR